MPYEETLQVLARLSSGRDGAWTDCVRNQLAGQGIIYGVHLALRGEFRPSLQYVRRALSIKSDTRAVAGACQRTICNQIRLRWRAAHGMHLTNR